MKTIYSLILGNLKKMLIISLGAAAAILIGYSFLSLQRAENQAADFVTNNLESLVEAGVNAQDVNGIDKEIGRFVRAWRETQDLELRVDVFLDEKQIGHAGQLQPFQYFYSKVVKEEKLPSGQTLRVEIQLKLIRFIVLNAFFLLLFELFIFVIFFELMRSVKKSIRMVTDPLESKVAVLKEIAKGLPDSARKYKEPPASEVFEISELGLSIGSLTAQITDLYDRLLKVTVDRERVRMAEQVAHNVKGVVATLQLKVSALPVSILQKDDLLRSVDSLRDISSELLNSRKWKIKSVASHTTKMPSPLIQTIRTVVAAKRTQYSTSEIFHIEIENEFAPEIFAKIGSGDLQGIISNLIDNAVEAMSSQGNIKVKFGQRDSMVELSVADTGKGIPAHVISSLTQEGFSYEKPEGNGIGLFHAKEVMDAIGGSIKIESTEKVGTTITLAIPEAVEDQGLATAIEIPAGASIICVDDDPMIHQGWDTRFGPLNLSTVVHLYSVKEFEDWMKEHGHGSFGSRLYLVDFDLKSSEKTGLCLIEEYGLALESILVSGLASDEDVMRRSREMRLKRISKDCLDQVPIRIQKQKSLLGVI